MSARPLREFCGLLVLVFALHTGVASAATITTYSDRASFEAATLSLTLEDFEAYSDQILQTLDLGDVVFSSTSGYPSDLFVAPDGYGGDPSITTATLFANYYGTPLIATFDPGITAVGADVASYVGDAQISILIEDDAGSLVEFFITPSPEQFFGFTVKGGEVAQVQWDPPAGYTAGIDDFARGTVIPEPASALLFGIGALIVAGALRRQA